MCGSANDSYGGRENSGWTRESLRNAVQKYIVTSYKWETLDGTPFSKYRKAAVLVPLFLRDGKVHVWLTKRSNQVGTYKGQVSFPGGMKEPADEDEIATALREAKEEVGFEPDQVEVLGPLYPKETLSKILITPIVGIVSEDFKPLPNEEVDFAFHLPLDRFLKSENCAFLPYQREKYSGRILFFYDAIDGQSITTWGLTAVICAELAVGVFQKETEYTYALGKTLLPEDPYFFAKIRLNDLKNEGIMSKL